MDAHPRVGTLGGGRHRRGNQLLIDEVPSDVGICVGRAAVGTFVGSVEFDEVPRRRSADAGRSIARTGLHPGLAQPTQRSPVPVATGAAGPGWLRGRTLRWIGYAVVVTSAVFRFFSIELGYFWQQDYGWMSRAAQSELTPRFLFDGIAGQPSVVGAFVTLGLRTGGTVRFCAGRRCHRLVVDGGPVLPLAGAAADLAR